MDIWAQHGIRRRCQLSLAAVLGIHLAAALTPGQTPAEYALKAAVLYNITKFVEWLPEAFKNPADPIAICVLGENPFGDTLNQVVSGKVRDGRKFAVRQISDVSNANGCQILFVSSSEQKHFHSILEGAPSRGTLTIGDTEGFATKGGIVNLRVEGDKIRLQINVGVAEKQRIRVSSRLLGLADIVKSGAGR
jgi:hypothetical protein